MLTLPSKDVLEDFLLKETREMQKNAEFRIMMKELTNNIQQAVSDIKTAILQGQYEAAKGVNRIQLAVYFGIGKYVSQRTRKGAWGTGALEAISGQLRRELLGLRGYSATQMKEMRLFYETWTMLDVNSSVATDELTSAITIAEMEPLKSSVTTDELQVKKNKFKSEFCKHVCKICICSR